MKIKKERPLGSATPWVWVLEPTFGCNLRCGHCSCRLMEPSKYQFMNEKTWIAAWKVITATAPTCRVDLCISGEPTLHPDLPAFLKIARELSPLSQIQITTNGTILRSGKITYRQLLDAGANIIYTDMYGTKDLFIKLAKESGTLFYEYYSAPKDAPSPWTYHGPDLKMIVLQEQPENWPKSRFRAGLLGTWYNHLDWEAAAKFGLSPVKTPPARRCNQPFIYVPVAFSGAYLLCCQDNWHETEGIFGSVHDGVEGFKRYWFGKEMMLIRRRLRNKNRLDTSYCSRCCITFSRCDYIYWKDRDLSKYWDGSRWKQLPPIEKTDPKWTTQQEKMSKQGLGFHLTGDTK